MSCKKHFHICALQNNFRTPQEVEKISQNTFRADVLKDFEVIKLVR